MIDFPSYLTRCPKSQHELEFSTFQNPVYSDYDFMAEELNLLEELNLDWGKLAGNTITNLFYHYPIVCSSPGSYTPFEYLLRNLHIIDAQHSHLFKEKFTDEFVEVVSTLKEILENTPTPPGLEGYQTFYGNREDYKLITKAVFKYRLPYGESVSLLNHFPVHTEVQTESLTR